MDHLYIEDEFIIEKFIAGDLDPDCRKLFFEHCLECGDCCKRVYLAGKIEEALFSDSRGLKHEMVVKPIKRKMAILYSAAAVFLILAFAGGYFTHVVQNHDGDQMMVKNNNPANVPLQISDKKKDSVKIDSVYPLKQPKQNESKNLAVAPDKRSNLIAMVDAKYDLGNLNQLLKLNAGVYIKGGQTNEIDVDKAVDLLNRQSNMWSGEIEIKKPEQNGGVSSHNLFEAEWETNGKNPPCSLILLDGHSGKILFSYKDIKERKFISQKALSPGNYFMVIYDQESTSWHAVRFHVK